MSPANPAAVEFLPILAASSWLLGAILAVPGIAVLLISAVVFADSAFRRMVNLCFGFVGSLGGLVALGQLAAIPDFEWLLEGNARLIVGSLALAGGGMCGIWLSVFAGKLIAVVRRQG